MGSCNLVGGKRKGLSCLHFHCRGQKGPDLPSTIASAAFTSHLTRAVTSAIKRDLTLRHPSD
jgi:hypothetical protein